jgi:RNA polymerase primary sigma factor
MSAHPWSGGESGGAWVASSRPAPGDPAGTRPVDPVDEVLDRSGSKAVLTREGEVELARRIEEGQRRGARAVLGLPAAAREIAAVFGRLSRGEMLSAICGTGCTEGELQRAVREIRTGERQAGQARHELIMANQRLVVTIARKIRREGSQLVDLLQDGNIGLMRAVDRFDHRLGYRFSTYATWWIRQSINRAFFDTGRVIRLPVHVHDKLGQLRKTTRQLFLKLGRRPTTSELATATSLREATVRQLLAANLDPASLDAPLDATEGGRLVDVIADEGATPPTSLVAATELKVHTDDALATLLPREAYILRKRFGFVDGSFHTLKDLSHDFGLTCERIRQIEALALGKLRRNPKTRSLRAFLEG